jgi:hypothetical protein
MLQPARRKRKASFHSADFGDLHTHTQGYAFLSAAKVQGKKIWIDSFEIQHHRREEFALLVGLTTIYLTR